MKVESAADILGSVFHNPAFTAAVSNAQKKEQENTFGPDMKRPEGDFRSAQQIIEDSPILKNLGNQSHVKDMLKERVGDFETDPDAAYRATQVLEHIEQLDESGDPVFVSHERNDPGNGKVDGFTKSGEAYHGTEAGRLQDFGKYGWDSLKGDFQTTKPKEETPKGDAPSNRLPLPGETRPEDDHRSAEQIIEDNPLLKNLGNQSGVKDALKKRVGDFEHDADAAWRAVQVLNYVENYDETGKHIEGGDVGNGKIDGFTKDGEARHGTEAGRLQDFGKYGYDNLKGLDGNSADDQIKDLNARATEQAVKDAGGDPSKVGADYFKTGESDASGADKAAAIIQLSEGLANFQAGADAFRETGPNVSDTWEGEGLSPGQERQKFIDETQSKIDKLSEDPDVQKFLNEQGSEALQNLVASDPALKAELERRLDVSSSTESLKNAFSAKDDKGNPVSTTEALSNFIKYPDFYAQALGKEPDYTKALENAPQDIKDKVKAEYEHITSGQEIKDLIDSGTPPDKAVIQSAVNKAVYDAVLDDKTVAEGTDAFFEANAKLGREDLVKDKTIDDFYRGLGVTGADDPRLAQVIEDNIANFTTPGEAPPKTADVISAVRNVEDAMRGGAKYDDAIKKVQKEWGGKLPSGVSDTYKAGVMHGVSGVLLAGAIGVRLADGQGGSTAQTTGQSFQAAGLLIEGGSKFVQDQFSRAGFNAPKYVKDVENVGKSLGGVTGNILGLVTGAISAKQASDNGDKVGAGFQGTFAGLNGISAVAGAVEVATYVVPRVTTVATGVAEAAGVIGGAAGAIAGAVGGIAAVGGLIYAIVASIQADEKLRKQEEEWYTGLEDQFDDFGITPPDLSTIIAPENGFIPEGPAPSGTY